MAFGALFGRIDADCAILRAGLTESVGVVLKFAVFAIVLRALVLTAEMRADFAFRAHIWGIRAF